MGELKTYYCDIRRVSKVLVQLGAHRRNGASGHVQFVLAGRSITVPHHGRELAIGTARAISRSVEACGFPRRRYEELLLAA